MRSCYDLPTLERRRKIQKQNRRRPIRELNPEAFPAPLNWLGLIASLFQERCLDLDQFVSTLPSVASTSDVSVGSTSPTLTPAPNPHSTRCTVGASHPAISCLGAFQTPAVRAWGRSRHAGIRKPAQNRKWSVIRSRCVTPLIREANQLQRLD
jgi:hypothetical protein